MINGQKLNIKTRLNRVMKDIEANLMKTSTFYKSFDTRDLFSRENYARDLRDFIYGSYSDLNIMEELDKADIAFVMAPFDFYFIVIWDKKFCQDMYKYDYKKMKEQGFKMNNTFLNWIEENEKDIDFGF